MSTFSSELETIHAHNTRSVSCKFAVENIKRLLMECNKAETVSARKNLAEAIYCEIVRSRGVLFDVRPSFREAVFHKTRELHKENWTEASRFNMVLFGVSLD